MKPIALVAIAAFAAAGFAQESAQATLDEAIAKQPRLRYKGERVVEAMVNGKLVDVISALYQAPVFTPDSNHILHYRLVYGGTYELCVDNKPAVKFSGIPLPGQPSRQPLWEMSAEGVYTFLAVVDGTLKRFRVTPPADTTITTMIAEVEAAEAKLVADAAAAKKKADDELAAKKQKADDDPS